MYNKMHVNSVILADKSRRLMSHARFTLHNRSITLKRAKIVLCPQTVFIATLFIVK